MFARLVSAQARNDKLNEIIRIWKEKDIPLMKSVKSVKGVPWSLSLRRPENR